MIWWISSIILGLLPAGGSGLDLSPSFERVVIDNDIPGGYQVEVADVNGDGKLDLVGVGGGTCAWYENPTWTKRVVTTPRETPDIISSATADLDGDGQAEIAIAYDFAMNEPKRGKLLLASQPTGGSGAKWTTREITAFPSIHRLRWSDLEADGKLDLIVAPIFGAAATPPKYDQQPAVVVVFRPGLAPKLDRWIPQSVGGDLVLHAIKVADLDGDGRPEILTAGNSGVTRFDLDRETHQWSSKVLTAGEPGSSPKRGCSEVQPGRLADGSKFLATVDPWHGPKVAIVSAKDATSYASRVVVESGMVDGHALWTADVDGDGSDEVFAGYRGVGTSVLMFQHVGSTWVKTVIDPDMAAQDLRGGDLDGDGVPDVVAIGGKTHNLVWYRPVRKK